MTYLGNFSSLLAFVVASGDDHLVVLSYRHRSDAVLGPQVLGQRSAHDLAPITEKTCKFRHSTNGRFVDLIELPIAPALRGHWSK